ncbi:MAG: hypothetical protein U5K51_05205 [Flavobacteriaceae bacterium]|nr:hypothetical protein [Flavobacteriaceae bacterium]
MIKNSIKMIAILFASSMLLTSCYSYTTVVGEGAKGNTEISKMEFILCCLWVSTGWGYLTQNKWLREQKIIPLKNGTIIR